MSKIILAIGAHPDDCELGCYATLAYHKHNGDVVHLLVLSKGEAGGPGARRVDECKKAAHLLGADSITIESLHDRMITNDYRTIEVIKAKVNELQPDRIYTHSPHDNHQDHRNAALATMTLYRHVNDILLYESPSVSLDFTPRVFVNITSFFNVKIEALKLHETQNDKYYIRTEAIAGLAEYRAFQAGMLATRNHSKAEAFDLAKLTF
ncbi:MAG: PIG-L family deacetylase [Euryarchaeota archaeon]|nr:PIG-L family deacetylase [Euryarchaeota archaeon]